MRPKPITSLLRQPVAPLAEDLVRVPGVRSGHCKAIPLWPKGQLAIYLHTWMDICSVQMNSTHPQ